MTEIVDKEKIIATLRAHERELKEAGVVQVRVFGSVVRGEANEASDVDLLAQFDEAKPISLIGLVRIENHLSDLLGRKVDLVQERSLKARIRANVEREAELVF
jgi:predicted nucleotidyltransferase